ncbi:MAG TPA: dipeptidase [Candidatus Acidoferrales bacterium]|nr:dipeptidase [Candidatus Acidoferrales bacterium]
MGGKRRLSAGLLLVLPLWLAARGDVAPRAAALHDDAIVIDTHIDVPQRLLDEDFDLAPRDPYGHIDLPRMKEGGLDAGFMSIWADMEHYAGPAATKRALQLIDTVYRQVERHPDQLLLARTADDIRRAQREGKVALLMGMEGATPIDDDLSLLRDFHRLGIRYVTLTHTLNNNWIDSSTDKPVHNGLTDFGRQVVREMNRLGILVDISHVSDKAFFDTLEVTEAPIIASHSSCRALTDIPRNMSDEQLRGLARNGGVVQIAFGCWFVTPGYDAAYEQTKEERERRKKEVEEKYPDHHRAAIEKYKIDAEFLRQMPRGTLDNILDHIDHAVQVAGIDHVGLGSDFDGVGCLPEGLDDVSFLPRLTQGLLARGYSDADVKKILGGNTLRVMEEAERVAGRLRSNQP